MEGPLEEIVECSTAIPLTGSSQSADVCLTLPLSVEHNRRTSCEYTLPWRHDSMVRPCHRCTELVPDAFGLGRLPSPSGPDAEESMTRVSGLSLRGGVRYACRSILGHSGPGVRQCTGRLVVPMHP